jgi:hypothetical protein
VGRDAYRRVIQQRLIPSLRAFNPSLILLSMGFDALNGDVGNCKHTHPAPSAAGGGGAAGKQAQGPQRGMDLSVLDIAWVTTEVMKIADICCNGRLVSVLEGGYGQYASSTSTSTSAVSKVHGTRSSSYNGPQIDAYALVRCLPIAASPCLFNSLYPIADCTAGEHDEPHHPRRGRLCAHASPRRSIWTRAFAPADTLDGASAFARLHLHLHQAPIVYVTISECWELRTVLLTYTDEYWGTVWSTS